MQSRIQGGVCAASGFKAGGIHCGIKTTNTAKLDLMIIFSDRPCSAAAVYTKNVVKASPVLLTRENLKDGKARAIIANSGNANACAPNGMENARRMAAAAASALGIDETDVVVASTGVIGQELRINVIERAVPTLVPRLTHDESASSQAASAIMTTDTFRKEFAVSAKIGGVQTHTGGIGKGSGMIHPNMGTMLCFVTTDVAISPEMLQKAVSYINKRTFSRITVDGDTSTNDMLVVLANGAAGNEEITTEGEDYEKFVGSLSSVCLSIARSIAEDGEGATHLITCYVRGAKTEDDAVGLAKSICGSSLVKAAMFGTDANWGRVLCAMGYSGVDFNPKNVSIAFRSAAGIIPVCINGEGLPFDEIFAKKVLSEHSVTIDVTMKEGEETGYAYGCDLTYDYVKINGDYRT